MIGHLRRIMRTARRLATDQRIPKWCRCLLVFGLLPIPGPVDDVVLLAVAALLLIRYRPLVREAWEQ